MRKVNILEIIEKKRDKQELSKEEIEYFITGYTSGETADYQASALIMAIYLNGMTKQETTNLTIAMAHSGEMLDLSILNEVIVDKHSTGGVGDKVSLILLPLVASLGIPVAKMSGKGLGFTGGTRIYTRISDRYQYPQLCRKCGKSRHQYDFTNIKFSTSR